MKWYFLFLFKRLPECRTQRILPFFYAYSPRFSHSCVGFSYFYLVSILISTLCHIYGLKFGFCMAFCMQCHLQCIFFSFILFFFLLLYVVKYLCVRMNFIVDEFTTNWHFSVVFGIISRSSCGEKELCIKENRGTNRTLLIIFQCSYHELKRQRIELQKSFSR